MTKHEQVHFNCDCFPKDKIEFVATFDGTLMIDVYNNYSEEEQNLGIILSEKDAIALKEFLNKHY